MIATNSFEITVAGRPEPLYLAPYDETDLEQVLPLDTAELLMDAAEVEAYRGTAADIIRMTRDAKHVRSWGMFNRDIEPDNFIGTVSLHDMMVGPAENKQPTKLLLDIGTYVMNASMRSGGLGTYAKAGLIHHALEEDGTRCFFASTDIRNQAARRSLGKLGFVDHAELEGKVDPDKQTREFMLVPQAYVSAVGGGHDGLTEALHQGWQQYQQLAAAIAIKEA